MALTSERPAKTAAPLSVGKRPETSESTVAPTKLAQPHLGQFDRKAYQREYMRKWREKKNRAKLKEEK
jgi:hypothetical protein